VTRLTPAQISEKPAPAVETITPAAPTIVEPATVDIGAPATAAEIESVPAIVPAVVEPTTPAATEDAKVAADDKPATSPKESKKQGFFDKLMSKRASPKKSDEPAAAAEAVKEPETKAEEVRSTRR